LKDKLHFLTINHKILLENASAKSINEKFELNVQALL